MLLRATDLFLNRELGRNWFLSWLFSRRLVSFIMNKEILSLKNLSYQISRTASLRLMAQSSLLVLLYQQAVIALKLFADKSKLLLCFKCIGGYLQKSILSLEQFQLKRLLPWQMFYIWLKEVSWNHFSVCSIWKGTTLLPQDVGTMPECRATERQHPQKYKNNISYFSRA